MRFVLDVEHVFACHALDETIEPRVAVELAGVAEDMGYSDRVSRGDAPLAKEATEAHSRSAVRLGERGVALPDGSSGDGDERAEEAGRWGWATEVAERESRFSIRVEVEVDEERGSDGETEESVGYVRGCEGGEGRKRSSLEDGRHGEWSRALEGPSSEIESGVVVEVVLYT